MPRPLEVIRKGAEAQVLALHGRGLGPYAISSALKREHNISIDVRAIIRYLETVPSQLVEAQRDNHLTETVTKHVLGYKDEIKTLYDQLRKEHDDLVKLLDRDAITPGDRIRLAAELDKVRNRMLTVMDRAMTIDKLTNQASKAPRNDNDANAGQGNTFINIGVDAFRDILNQADKRNAQYERRLGKKEPENVIDVEKKEDSSS